MQAISSTSKPNTSTIFDGIRNFILVGFLYLALATGTILPIENENGYIYIHTILISVFAAYMLLDKRTAILTGKSAIIFMPFVLILFASLSRTFSEDLAYVKIEGAILSTVFCIAITVLCSKYLTLISFLKYFILFSVFMLIVTIIYRNFLGLESRDDRFFLNGPIVFGWIMGFNAILSFFLFQSTKGRIYLVAASLFIGATLLTGSKGPMVAVGLAVAILALRWINRPSTWLFMIFGALSIFASGAYVSQDNLERYQTLERLIDGESSEADYGSVGTRYDAWLDSIDMFLANPLFGVGLGNWNHFALNKIDYPHNFIMELIAETGLFGLITFVILIIYIIVKSDICGKIIIFYFMICMSFSGDMSYYRFMIAIPLAMILISHDSAAWRRTS